MSTTPFPVAAIEPRFDVDAQLAELWRRNLGGPVPAEADYFAAGGDSLRGTQLLLWIQESFGIELSLLDLFESRTLAAQGALLRARVRTPAPVSHARSTDFSFFGPPGGRLFGTLERSAAPANAGVVLCYPIGQEYMRIHRTYAELARALAAADIAALRFDYYGCGDSEGESGEGTLRRWAEDIRLAVRELRAHARVGRVYVVGSRIGANLALEVSVTERFDGVVLWEPVLDGRAYLASLRRAHETLLRSNAELDGYEERPLRHCFTELVGFPFSRVLHDEIAAIDLMSREAQSLDADALVVVNTDKPQLCEALRRLIGPNVTYSATGESDGIWLKEDRQNKGLIPVRAVQEIASWISRRSS